MISFSKIPPILGIITGLAKLLALEPMHRSDFVSINPQVLKELSKLFQKIDSTLIRRKS